MNYITRFIRLFLLLILFASCCKKQSANHTLSGYIYSETDSLPLQNHSFRIKFSDQCGFNHKYFYDYPFTTNALGYFEVKVNYYAPGLPLCNSAGHESGNYIQLTPSSDHTFADTIYVKP